MLSPNVNAQKGMTSRFLFLIILIDVAAHAGGAPPWPPPQASATGICGSDLFSRSSKLNLLRMVRWHDETDVRKEEIGQRSLPTTYAHPH